MHNPEDLIGSVEAAETLSIDRSTLSRWVSAGKIAPALRGSGTRGEKFFTRHEVEALAAKTGTTAEAKAPKAGAA